MEAKTIREGLTGWTSLSVLSYGSEKDFVDFFMNDTGCYPLLSDKDKKAALLRVYKAATKLHPPPVKKEKK